MTPDKRQHFSVGFLLTFFVWIILHVLDAKLDALLPDAVWSPHETLYELAFMTAVIAGLSKELYDYRNPDKGTADFWDFLATSAGGALACLLLWTLGVMR